MDKRNTTMTETLKVGDKVWYRPRGESRNRPAVITGFGEKDDRAVIDVDLEDTTDPDEKSRWGYEDQIRPRS